MERAEGGVAEAEVRRSLPQNPATSHPPPPVKLKGSPPSPEKLPERADRKEAPRRMSL